MEAWDAIGKLLETGSSWSGRERNVSFLNTGDGRFVSFSGLAGLDHDSDSRAVAVVDWDRDGDLDLWVSNRNEVRVRLLRNDVGKENRFIAVRLEGKTINRDAIGARVELLLQGDEQAILSKTLRAGEGYLSQTSKWLHFPVPAERTVSKLRVYWPGKAMEEFDGLRLGARLELIEGSGSARVLDTLPPSPSIAKLAPSLPERTDRARVVPHARMPLPALNYLGADGEKVTLDASDDNKLHLIILWASWCGPCLAELRELEASRARLAEHRIEVLPLNVENFDQSPADRVSGVQRFFKKNRLSFPGALATTEMVEVLDVVQRSIVGRQDSLPIPSSFLLDSRGNLVALYKGRFDLEGMLGDARDVLAGKAHDRDFALPFHGRWYVAPFGVDRFTLAEKLIEVSNATAALSYLKQHLGVALARSSEERVGGLMGEKDLTTRDQRIASFYRRTGSLFARANLFSNAVEAFDAGLVFAPDSLDIRADLAVALQAEGDYKSALGHFRTLQQERPEQIAVLNSLAWILSTASDPALRQATEAVKLAEQACSLSGYELAETLDTLAAAYAAVGDYPRAIATAEQGLERATVSGSETVAALIRQRMIQYEKGQPYISNSP